MQLLQAREQYIRWLLVTRDLSPHTIRAYNGDIAAFERFAGGQLAVTRIDRDTLVGFMEDQQANGLSATSIRRRAAGLRGFCQWLLGRQLLEADPWIGTTVVLGRSRKLPRILPSHELDRLLGRLRAAAGSDEADQPSRQLTRPHEATTLLAVALMVATGMRVHEVVGLEHRDVNLPERTIRLTGKGRRERQVYLTNDWITGIAERYMIARLEMELGHSHFLFNSRYAPLTPAAMRTRLRNAAESAGLSTKVTPHMLRHTAATQLIEAGVDIRYIQRLLGHSSLTTTEIYTHVSDTSLRQVVTDADVLGRVSQMR